MSVRQSNTQAFLYRERPFLTLCCEIVSGSAFFCLNGCDNCCLESRVCCCGSCRSFYFASLVCVPALVIINPKGPICSCCNWFGTLAVCVNNSWGFVGDVGKARPKHVFVPKCLFAFFSPCLCSQVKWYTLYLLNCTNAWLFTTCVQLCVCVCVRASYQ